MRWRARIRNRVGPLDLDVEMETTRSVSALVGPNASGKTTILRTLAGARNPTEGTIVVGDRTLFDSAAAVQIEPEDRQGGICASRGYGLFPHLSALDNVAFGLRRPAPPRGIAGPELSSSWRRWGARAWHSVSPVSSPAGRSSGWPLLAPWLPNREFCSWTSPSRRWIRRAADRCGPFWPTSSGTKPDHVDRDPRSPGCGRPGCPRVGCWRAAASFNRGDLDALRSEPATDFVAEFTGSPGHGS